jgi:hypothetical protein
MGTQGDMFFGQILVSQNATIRLNEIRVRIKTGIEKGNSIPFAGVALIVILSHMRRHDGIAFRLILLILARGFFQGEPLPQTIDDTTRTNTKTSCWFV